MLAKFLTQGESLGTYHYLDSLSRCLPSCVCEFRCLVSTSCCSVHGGIVIRVAMCGKSFCVRLENLHWMGLVQLTEQAEE